MKRNLTDHQVRELVVIRRSKGWAFMKDGKAYRDKIKAEVRDKSREELFREYDYCLYDVNP